MAGAGTAQRPDPSVQRGEEAGGRGGGHSAADISPLGGPHVCGQVRGADTAHHVPVQGGGLHRGRRGVQSMGGGHYTVLK